MFSESFNCDMEIGQRAALYLGTTRRECLLGFLEYGEDGIEAFTADNVSLGLFEDEGAADRAHDDIAEAIQARLDAKIGSNGGSAPLNDEPHPMLAAALGYAQRGWDVFPAPPGQKKSYKSAQYSDGAKWGKTRDPAQIQKDFRRWPEANIGIPTGAANKIWVTETDTPEGHDVDGDASMRALEEKHGPLPDTLMAISPSGSKHRYFNYPEGIEIRNSTSAIAPGIDVRGEGGMVIAPPSVRGDGQYKWLNDLPIADAPQWLLDLAVAASRGGGKGGNTWAEKAKPAGVFDGQKPSAAFADLDLNHSLGQGISVELPPIEQIRAAFAVIPNNDRDWDDWNTHGLALFAATAGSDDGLAVFHEWSGR